jgi:hypothetical protein
MKWATDMRPERSLTVERCEELAAGGALSAALGVESAAPRVLSLIDKGVPVETVRNAIVHLSRAGVAVEAMCFSDFPTETYREAMQTVHFIEELCGELSLFILGRFDLTHGSLVAQKPGEFGIREVWGVDGDELGTGLFFAERRRPKAGREQTMLEQAVGALSSQWRLRRYPWAGALSTAHTLLWYAHYGKDVFRRVAPSREARVPGARTRAGTARFDVARVLEQSAREEAALWERMVRQERRVSRKIYEERAAALPHALPLPGEWSYGAAGMLAARDRKHSPIEVRRQAAGRRPSHAANATKH